MGHVVLVTIGGFLAATVGVFVTNDVYACASVLQRWLLGLATHMLPEHQREEAYKQWRGDLFTMPPSEILRTLYALDCLRAGFLLGIHFRLVARMQDSDRGGVGEGGEGDANWDELLNGFAVNHPLFEIIKRLIDFSGATL